MNTDEQFEQWWNRQKLGGFMNDQITADHVRAGWRIGAAAEREACAKVADEQAAVFASPTYATGQPLSSAGERFACKQIAEAIRARSKS